MNERPEDIPVDAWERNMKIVEELEKEREIYFENTLKRKPPLPPWLKYPGEERTSIFWRMGRGEDYLIEEAWLYLQYASPERLSKYREFYPEPDDWSGWYDNS